MRKIEETMCEAVKAHKNWTCNNTRVVNVSGVSHVYLHDNLIAIMVDEKHGKFTLAGWNTPTTRSRLRALGINVTGHIGWEKKATYKGVEIDSDKWYDK